ncbi:MAG: class I SAM-dependent methyltransferase [Williamsia sp.]|nr:class I SAM-dependent methyltransferase [Williamsia sp.]
MYSKYQLAKKFFHYRMHALNGKGHGIHSPFVFDFVKKVLNDKRVYPAYSQVEAVRKQLMQDGSVLHIHDMGAGSPSSPYKHKPVSAIAQGVIKPKKFAQLLYRIVRYYQPQTIVELGTSLGVTSAYLALANRQGFVTTLEGSEAVAAVARKNFAALSLSNIKLVTGNFDATLPQLLPQTGLIDLAFVDGNHAREPTLRYFDLLLNKTCPSSLIIFDDIHWSKEMEEAWEVIKAHPAVRLSIDLFFIGIVFFREEFKVKQHFVIRY